MRSMEEERQGLSRGRENFLGRARTLSWFSGGNISIILAGFPLGTDGSKRDERVTFLELSSWCGPCTGLCPLTWSGSRAGRRRQRKARREGHKSCPRDRRRNRPPAGHESTPKSGCLRLSVRRGCRSPRPQTVRTLAAEPGRETSSKSCQDVVRQPWRKRSGVTDRTKT